MLTDTEPTVSAYFITLLKLSNGARIRTFIVDLAVGLIAISRNVTKSGTPGRK
jgi:hypothetical protein